MTRHELLNPVKFEWDVESTLTRAFPGCEYFGCNQLGGGKTLTFKHGIPSSKGWFGFATEAEARKFVFEAPLTRDYTYRIRTHYGF